LRVKSAITCFIADGGREGGKAMIVMDKITFAEAWEGHRELWDWLAETDGNELYKHTWPGWAEYDRKACNGCFACEIVKIRESGCWCCPIKWPEELICAEDRSIYDMWYCEEDPAERKRLAERIRDLPWREKEK
jgi:hypothetical protein